MNKIIWVLLLAALALGLSQFLLRENHKVLQDKLVTHLTVWNMPPKSLPLDRQLWDETVARFEAANPDIKIEGVERDYQPEEFITVMAGGKGPDVVKVWVGAIQTLANLGFLQPVDAYIQNWPQKDYIKPVLWESTKVSDHLRDPRGYLFLIPPVQERPVPQSRVESRTPASYLGSIGDHRQDPHEPKGRSIRFGSCPKDLVFPGFRMASRR